MLLCQAVVKPESFQWNGRLKQKTGTLSLLKKAPMYLRLEKTSHTGMLPRKKILLYIGNLELNGYISSTILIFH
jgi:hypothetical protein